MQREITAIAASFGNCDSDEEDDNANEEGPITDRNYMKSTKALKTLNSQLKTIVKASEDVLEKLNDGYYVRCPDPNVVCDFGADKALSETEIAFYQANESVMNILQSLKAKIDAVKSYNIYLVSETSIEQEQGKYRRFIICYISYHTNTLMFQRWLNVNGSKWSFMRERRKE